MIFLLSLSGHGCPEPVSATSMVTCSTKNLRSKQSFCAHLEFVVPIRFEDENVLVEVNRCQSSPVFVVRFRYMFVPSLSWQIMVHVS